MTDADARRIATLMAELMRREMPARETATPPESFDSLADILHVGLVLIESHRQSAEAIAGGIFPIRPQMFAALACFPQDEKLLIDEFTAGLAASDEDPAKLEATQLHISVSKAKIAEEMAVTAGKFLE